MTNAWQEHLQTYRSKHPGMSYKDCMKEAAKTYKKKSGSGLKLAGEGLKLAGGRKSVSRKALSQSADFQKNIVEDSAKIVHKFTENAPKGSVFGKMHTAIGKMFGSGKGSILTGPDSGTMHTGGMYGSGLGLAGGAAGGASTGELFNKALGVLKKLPVKAFAKKGANLAAKQVKKLAEEAYKDPEKAISVASKGVELAKAIKKKGVKKSGKEVKQLKELAEGKPIAKTPTTSTTPESGAIASQVAQDLLEESGASEYSGASGKKRKRKTGRGIHGGALRLAGGALKLAGGRSVKGVKETYDMYDLDELEEMTQEGGFIFTLSALIAGAVAVGKAAAVGAVAAGAGLAVEAIADSASGPATEQVIVEYVDKDGNPVDLEGAGLGLAGGMAGGKLSKEDFSKAIKVAQTEAKKVFNEAKRAIEKLPVKKVKDQMTASALKAGEAIVKKVKQGKIRAKEAVIQFAKKHLEKPLEKALDTIKTGSGFDGEHQGSMVGSGWGAAARGLFRAGAKAVARNAGRIMKRVVRKLPRVSKAVLKSSLKRAGKSIAKGSVKALKGVAYMAPSMLMPTGAPMDAGMPAVPTMDETGVYITPSGGIDYAAYGLTQQDLAGMTGQDYIDLDSRIRSGV